MTVQGTARRVQRIENDRRGIDVAVERLDVSAYRVPTDLPRPTGRPAGTPPRSLSSRRMPAAGPARVHLRGRGDPRARTCHSRPERRGTRCVRGHGDLGGARANVPQPWPAWPRLDGHCCNRRRALGPESAAAVSYRSQRFSMPPATQFLFMAAAASPRIPTPACASSSKAGSGRESPASRSRSAESLHRDLERVRVAREAIGETVSSTWMPTARSPASRRCGSPTVTQSVSTCAGSKSRSRPTISTGYGCSATGPRRGWRSPPASTATCSPISRRCSRRAPSTAFRPTPRAVRGSPAFCGSRPFARRVRSRSRRHCGPSIHVHPCCAITPLRHLEYFHDHARIERLLFDGALEPVDGCLRPISPSRETGSR